MSRCLARLACLVLPSPWQKLPCWHMCVAARAAFAAPAVPDASAVPAVPAAQGLWSWCCGCATCCCGPTCSSMQLRRPAASARPSCPPGTPSSWACKSTSRTCSRRTRQSRWAALGWGGGWVVGLGGLGLGHAACAWRLAAGCWLLAAGCWLLVLGAAARCARIHCHSSCRLASGVWPPTTTALPLLQVLATYLELEYRTATDGMGDPMMSP